jgi:hypothetical protein
LNPSYAGARPSQNPQEVYDRHLQLIKADQADDGVAKSLKDVLTANERRSLNGFVQIRLRSRCDSSRGF